MVGQQLDRLLSEPATPAGDVVGGLRAVLARSTARLDDVALAATLRRVVDAAARLTDARYVALVVSGRDGEPREFVFAGVDGETVHRIGRLPAHEGVLGLLVGEARPLRAGDIGGHPKAAGFPSHHPSMTSFLGVPIHAGARLCGSLYLANSARGRFSQRDEETVCTLGTVAAALIENSCLFGDL